MGEWTKTKLMLISTQVEVVVKVEVALGNMENMERLFTGASPETRTYLPESFWFN